MDTVSDVTAEAPVPRSRDAAKTRNEIVAAARKVFSEWGYEAATVRQIAVEAGVAANLITRYFGGKAGLFQAASNIDLGVVAAVDGPFQSLGARIAATVLTRYETGPTADPLQMLARSAGTPNGAGLGAYFAEQAARPLVAALTTRWGGDQQQAADRVAAAGALILGVIMSRYVLHEGPLGHTDEASLERWLSHHLQQLFDDPDSPSLHHSGGWSSPPRSNQGSGQDEGDPVVDPTATGGVPKGRADRAPAASEPQPAETPSG